MLKRGITNSRINSPQSLKSLGGIPEVEAAVIKTTAASAGKTSQTSSPASKLKIHEGQQGKHIPGHNNYVQGKSVLTENPQTLLQRAGTGQSVNKIPRGQPGFKERVDFGKVIGEYINPATRQGVPATKGIIHYAKDGIHIVPALP